MRFVDTSVLLYAASTDPAEEQKRRTALRILDAEDVALSVQVLQEFYVQATHSTRADPLSHEQAALLVEAFLRFPIQDNTVTLLRAALATRDRFRISFWDASIIEAARFLGCAVVLTEDLNHDQDFDGVRVENPFLASATT